MLKNSNSKQAKQNFIGSKVLKTIKESLTIVEAKRIKDTKSILKRHKKNDIFRIKSVLGLSRTRCNEYFKIMENLNIVEAVFDRKKKYYMLKK
jgi:hypothetical protein